MKRSKRHRIKLEQPESSTSRPPNPKEHDLAYYIHDRVELMHQVFSVLKSKELKTMAPECVRHISISDLQELCMEELLGISSKRLCAILDGATPPSDTESSESEPLETISLDSISSDEEILSQVSAKKKKHKHRSKSKSKKRTKSTSKDRDDEADKDQADRSRRAGLTVLELLELQARARAIRAQLQQEQSAVSTGQPSESVTGNSSDDEVEIKEEAAEVVEISSEDEKPNVQHLEEKIAASKGTEPDVSGSKTVTKKVNDLIITVPKANTSRKIKLKRNASSNSQVVDKVADNQNTATVPTVVLDVETSMTHVRKSASDGNTQSGASKSSADATKTSQSKTGKPIAESNMKDKNRKDKKKKRKKDKQNDKDGSDDDEITLQLSDTEKMDLLEDLDGKKRGKCSGTEDSSSDSSNESSEEELKDDKHEKHNNSDTSKIILDKDNGNVTKEISNQVETNKDNAGTNTISNETKVLEKEEVTEDKRASDSEDLTDGLDKHITEYDMTKSIDDKDETGLCESGDKTKTLVDETANSQPTDSIEKESEVRDKPLTSDSTLNLRESIQDSEMKEVETNFKEPTSRISDEKNKINEEIPSTSSNVNNTLHNKASITDKEQCNEKSDGELSDRDSSEVEASDFKPDVVCISDDDDKNGKKKKKKDKKSKKEKKSKKKKDFRESGDQNFYMENKSSPNNPNALENDFLMGKEVEKVTQTEKDDLKDIKVNIMDNFKQEMINTDTEFDDDVYEILELSDDSSCYEVEEISISKEPTAKEIEALSAKFDELERNRTADNIDAATADEKSEDLDNVSWKDRYLKSSKVKNVLTTANIMNAMRKKNLELKKKLQESKKDIPVEKEIEKEPENVEVPTSNFEDGTIDQYHTLEASTKYVDPVKDPNENTENTEIQNGTDNTKEKDTVTNEMKKEAKQLLKMYKMLLKYNDMTKQKDPNKKKKKKKKHKEKDKSVASQVETCG